MFASPTARIRRAAGAAVIVAPLALSLVGCSGAGDRAVSTVTVTSASVTTASGPTVTETVTVTPEVASGTDEPPATETTGAATAFDPCSLVTKAEADALAGITLDAPQKAPESCLYPGPTTGPIGQVEVYLGDGAKKFLEIERTLQHELTPLGGVGDESYRGESTTFVRVGSTWAALHLVRLNDPAENAGPLTELTRTIAARLG